MVAPRISTERDRSSGGVTFLLDGYGWVWCEARDEWRVRRMIFGEGGLADRIGEACALEDGEVL